MEQGQAAAVEHASRRLPHSATVLHVGQAHDPCVSDRTSSLSVAARNVLYRQLAIMAPDRGTPAQRTCPIWLRATRSTTTPLKVMDLTAGVRRSKFPPLVRASSALPNPTGAAGHFSRLNGMVRAPQTTTRQTIPQKRGLWILDSRQGHQIQLAGRD